MILILATIGFCISLYSYFVESKMKADATYKPACDINDRISCSKVMQSQYANIFFMSNSIVGMAYYVTVALLAYLELHTLIIVATTLGALASCVLAYLLYFKIKSLCIVCTSLYVVNALLLIASIY